MRISEAITAKEIQAGHLPRLIQMVLRSSTSIIPSRFVSIIANAFKTNHNDRTIETDFRMNH